MAETPVDPRRRSALDWLSIAAGATLYGAGSAWATTQSRIDTG